MATLGRVPAVGDTVPADGWTARVVDMDGHRVDRVRLVRDEPEATVDPDDADGEVAEADHDAHDARDRLDGRDEEGLS